MRHLAPIVPKLLFGLVLAALIAFIAAPLRPGPGTASAADPSQTAESAAGPWQPTPSPVAADLAGEPRNFGTDPAATGHADPAADEGDPANGAAEPGADPQPQDDDDEPTEIEPWEQDDFRIDTATPIDAPGGYALVDPDHLPMSLGNLGW